MNSEEAADEQYRAAGERKGARPASCTINRRRKDLKIKAFRAKLHFDTIKMLGGRSGQKSRKRLF